jgi:Protein of unknown function (DUF1566)
MLEGSKTMQQMPKLGIVSMAAVMAAWLGVWAPPASAQDSALVPVSAPVPATGQTECFNVPGKVINCAGTEQDGEIQAGAPLPNPRFVDNRNGTVTDRLTGLIWLKNADCFGAVREDVALGLAKTLANGPCGLSDHSIRGDWRLPNIKELESLIDFGFVSPPLSNAAGTAQWTQGDAFLNVRLVSAYWSSTSDAGGPFDALLIEMNGGRIFGLHKTNTALVWPVRGGEVRGGE